VGVKVDIRVPVGRRIPEVVEFVLRCEEAGFHGVGVHDHHHSGRDVYVTLALAASRTSDLTLYPAFLFPAHTFETGYEMPRAEVEAFGRVIRPRLEA
jgi:alkanesulfonate monooxygenase SsuD/methylene tetrahydromethanopterin reductase-like flavin-dependent oxidoreductase (luciferase family)